MERDPKVRARWTDLIIHENKSFKDTFLNCAILNLNKRKVNDKIMTKERSAFNNDYSCKFISLSSFRETNFNVGTCLSLSLILQAFNLDMLEIKDVDST